MNPVKDTHEKEIEDAGKQYLNSLLDKEGKTDEAAEDKAGNNNKLNKKRHARYNFNTDDIEVAAEEGVNEKSGSIVVPRQAKNAFNAEFTNYKAAATAQASAKKAANLKKLKKN